MEEGLDRIGQGVHSRWEVMGVMRIGWRFEGYETQNSITEYQT